MLGKPFLLSLAPTLKLALTVIPFVIVGFGVGVVGIFLRAGSSDITGPIVGFHTAYMVNLVLSFLWCW